MTVAIARSGRPRAKLAVARVRAWATRFLEVLQLDAELSVLLTDDATIHALNRDHRGKDKPTDVLAFALGEGEAPPQIDGPTPLGDVVLSLDTASRQAREHRRTLEDECAMLLAHGLLHLVGYDHETDAEEREMNRETARLLRALDERGQKSTEIQGASRNRSRTKPGKRTPK